MSDSSNTSSGIGITGFLFLIFLVLKLLGKIDWSWWWVTAPLWIPAGLALTLWVLFVIFLLLFGSKRRS